MQPNADREERVNGQLLDALDEHIERLPRPYREALLLCRLGGITYDEAARELGCPTSTVVRRVVHAERLLCKQMVLHGIPLNGYALSVLFDQASEVNPMPARLSDETILVALDFLNNKLIPNRASRIAQVILESMGTDKVMLI